MKARKELELETNIIEIIKSKRYTEKALHHLLQEKKRFEFKEKSRYIAIDPDEKREEKVKKSVTHI